MKKILYPFALISLFLGCWFSATLFGGLLNPGTLLALVILVILIAFFFTSVMQHVSHRIWIYAGLFILVTLYLPTSFYTKLFPTGDSEPFSTSVALTQLFFISAALLVTALLVNSGLTSYQEEFYSNSDEGRGSETWMWIVFVLSMLLSVKAFHSFYWFLVWDSTTDPLGIFWLPIPIFTVIFTSLVLILTRFGESKMTGFLNLLLIPALIVIFVLTQKVDFRQLTEDRAAHISQAIERYSARESQYPTELGQLFPQDLLVIPPPMFINGQDWCYDGGDDYFRLGYIYRQHWSDPRLIGKTFASQGEVAQLPPLCDVKITVLPQSYPNYPYVYLGNGE